MNNKIYIQKYKFDPFDHLTNVEYKTLMLEPKYTAIVHLIKILPEAVLRLVLEYIKQQFDFSARTSRRLQASIVNKDLSTFQYIYSNEYMSNNIMDFFEYNEESQEYPWKFYSLCECRTCGCTESDEFCYICEPDRVCRYSYIKGCTCQNGKRYLAFCMIYSCAHEIIKIGKTKKQKNKSKNDYQKMMDYVIASGPTMMGSLLMV
jgi:hypothetical protein